MSKFCGNCGQAADDAAKICGNCGTPFSGEIEYVDPETKAKNAKYIKLGIIGVAAIIVIVIAINIISGFVGYKGAVRKMMKAYEDADSGILVDMASDKFYSIEDDDSVDDYFDNVLTVGLDEIEESLDGEYKLSYEITKATELSNNKFKKLKEELEEFYPDADIDSIEEAMEVKITVLAEADDDEKKLKIEVTFTKEDGDWKIYEIVNNIK